MNQSLQKALIDDDQIKPQMMPN